jgi:hypothetical protein
MAGVSERGAWAGLIFVCCASCGRLTLDAEGNGWRFYEARDVRLHGFCRRCAEEERASARASPPPVAVCPLCDGVLEPQPQGGWVCREHGVTVVSKITAAS